MSRSTSPSTGDSHALLKPVTPWIPAGGFQVCPVTVEPCGPQFSWAPRPDLSLDNVVWKRFGVVHRPR